MKKTYFIITLVLLMAGCAKKQETIFPGGKSEIFGLARPVTLNDGETRIFLADFLADYNAIDSVRIPDYFYTKVDVQNGLLELSLKDSMVIPVMSEIKVFIKNVPYSILLKKSQKVVQRLTLPDNEQKYKNVQLAGDFNSWNPASTPMAYNGKAWDIELKLNPGRYAYQMVADGKWMLDPSNPDTISNNMGGFNSVLLLGEVFPDSVPFLTTTRFTENTISINKSRPTDKIFVLWQNTLMLSDLVSETDAAIQIKIPAVAAQMKRSFVRVFAYNKNGISNDLLIPLDNGKVLDDCSLLTREDYEATMMYFLMVDRFKNGNPANDEPVQDPEVDAKANYWGGDIAGIDDEIRNGYFKNLGVNAIWISPIVQNPKDAFVEFPEPHRKYSGYHGYWPISSSKVDYRLGTDKELKNMVDDAHNNGINIFLDYVSNHVHEDHPLYIEHPDWATELALPDGRANIRLWDEQRLTTWFDRFLPTLDYSRQEIVDVMTDSALYWIKTYNFDGFRHDATKHIPENFWRSLTFKLKNEIEIPENKRLFQIGETFGSRELIGSYVTSGMQDAQFDFNLYFDSRSVFALDKEPFTKLNQSVYESFAYYGFNHLMGNITGNHDLARFISYAGEAMTFEENDKEAGWNRNITVKNPVGYDKLKMLTAFIMTIPGIPVIYYGDEIGMPGANDPDNRRPMKFDNLTDNETSVFENAKELIQLRKTNPALIYGSFKTLAVSDNYWVYMREYFTHKVIVVMNKSAEKQAISFTVSGTPKNVTSLKNNKAEIIKNKLTVELKPYSFDIFYFD